MSSGRPDPAPAETVTIFGYGSLMTYESVLYTMPSAVRHRRGTLAGWRRVFSLVSISGVLSGMGDTKTREMAAVAIRPCEGSVVRGVLFEIPMAEFPAYKSRERRYRLEVVDVAEADGSTTRATVVVEQTDEELRNMIGPEEYLFDIAQYYLGQVWGRTDIFPLRPYLLQCLQAAAEMDVELATNDYMTNFLDAGYLSDGNTTIRQYICDPQYSGRFPEVLVQCLRAVGPGKAGG